MGVELHHGDCLDVMAGMEAESVDTVITDPPYGLEFMGKEWDHGVPGVAYWAEFLRVSKPGAMLCAFGGTRTHHRLMCAIEDAGWEIRDVLMYVYGSGFPKSHDVSKAIDKAAGAEREVVGESSYNDRRPNEGNSGNGTYSQGGYKAYITSPSTDAAALWDGWGTALKPAYEPIILAMKPLPGTFAQNALDYGVAGIWVDGCRVGTE
jgi:site-specific DNA-methyltransferase (adenine-specific)